MRDESQPVQQCPSLHLLSQLLEDALDASLKQQLELHLEDCEGCRQTLEEMSVDPLAWPELLEGLRRSQLASVDTPVAASDKTLVSISQHDQPEIEGYSHLQEIGRGGSGIIYRAFDSRLRRLVAIKVLRSVTPEQAIRFRNESSAAAQLQHPNVIEIFSSGISEGRVYLVMEYVAGGDLAGRLRAAPLPPRDAAQLVATLARAIEVAHSSGILHRDLKPANVLLSETLLPKITDFALAYWMDAGDGPTRTGEFLGTPCYMPPEQALATKGWISPQVDIYALGAILYESLTGRPPYQADSATATIDLLLNTDPISIRRINRNLPFDLETICSKCLEKQPNKRYASAGALADDLERYLAGRVISARPTPYFERAIRWALRNRVASVSSLLVLVSMLTLMLFWIRFTQKLQENAEAAIEGEVRAEKLLAEALEANAATSEILSFIAEDFFDAANPERGGGNLTVAQVLEQVDGKVADRFRNRPKLQASMQVAIGNLWRSLGKPQLAFGHLKSGAELYESMPEEFTTTARFDAIHALIQCLQDLRQLDEIPSWLEKIEPLKPLVPSKKRLSFGLTEGFIILAQQGPDAAIDHLEQLHERCVAELGEDDGTSVTAIGNLGVVYQKAGRSEEALQLFKQHWDGISAVSGPDDVSALTAANNYAFALVQIGKFDEAESIHRDTLERNRRTRGSQHLDTLGSQRNLAMVHWRMQRFGEAIDGMETTVDGQIAAFGPTDTRTINTLFQLSEMYLRAGETERGSRFFTDRTKEIIDQGIESTDFETFLINFAKLYFYNGEQGKASEMARRVETLLRKTKHSNPLSKLESFLKELESAPANLQEQ